MLKKRKLLSLVLSLVLLFTAVLFTSGLNASILDREPDDTTTTTTTASNTTTAAQTATLTVSATPASTTLSGTNKTTITYTVNNTGQATFTNIKVTDPDIAGSKTIGTYNSLSSGQSATFTYEATFTRTSTSQPRVEGTANGTVRSFTGSSTTINLENSSLEAKLSADTTSVEGTGTVNFTLTLTNGGSSTISDIKVATQSGTTLKEGVSVRAGSSTEVSFSQSFTESTSYYVTATGKDGNGNTVSTESNKISIEADGDGDQLIDPENGISLTITSDETELDKAQKVMLTMEVHNLLSEQGYSDIKIVDKETKKEITKIDSLAAGETKTLESEVNVTETTSFLYTVTAKAEDGTELSLDSNELKITVGEGNRNSFFILFLIIFVIIVILLIGTGIALFVISKKNKKNKKKNPYSEKYKKVEADPTLEAEGAENMAATAPLSTFTINDEDNQTMPINIPDQSSDFTTSDYDDMTTSVEEDDLQDTRRDDMFSEIGDEETLTSEPPRDQTQPLKRPFQTIDYDDLDPDKM